MNDEIICYCSHVTRQDILDAMDRGARTLADIRKMTGACSIGNCQEMNPKGT